MKALSKGWEEHQLYMMMLNVYMFVRAVIMRVIQNAEYDDL